MHLIENIPNTNNTIATTNAANGFIFVSFGAILGMVVSAIVGAGAGAGAGYAIGHSKGNKKHKRLEDEILGMDATMVLRNYVEANWPSLNLTRDGASTFEKCMARQNTTYPGVAGIYEEHKVWLYASPNVTFDVANGASAAYMGALASIAGPCSVIDVGNSTEVSGEGKEWTLGGFDPAYFNHMTGFKCQPRSSAEIKDAVQAKGIPMIHVHDSNVSC